MSTKTHRSREVVSTEGMFERERERVCVCVCGWVISRERLFRGREVVSRQRERVCVYCVSECVLAQKESACVYV